MLKEKQRKVNCTKQKEGFKSKSLQHCVSLAWELKEPRMGQNVIASGADFVSRKSGNSH